MRKSDSVDTNNIPILLQIALQIAMFFWKPN